MKTERERFLDVLDFHASAPYFLPPGWLWSETDERWRTQGWDGTPLSELFHTDNYVDINPFYGPFPDFSYELVEQTETIRTYINSEGILMRELIHHADNSMPQFLKFPVENDEDFTRMMERLIPNLPERYDAAWERHVAEGAASPHVRRCNTGRWGGFFGSLRNFMGLENLCIAFYDQPALVERMMEQRADMMIEGTEKVLERSPIDIFWFWEDMACNHGSLIDPIMFRHFALKHYRRVVDFLRAKGVKHIGLDSDGNISELIPLWLDAGINFLWPFEGAAGMDVIQVRKQYGKALTLGGGIAKRPILLGGEAMRREVDRIMPLVEEGGYIPELDHAVPPDITYPRFCEYMNYLNKRLGR